MQNRRTVIGLLVAMAVAIVWLQFVVPYLFKKYNYDPNWQAKQAAATQPADLTAATTQAGVSAAPTTVPTSGVAAVLRIAPSVNATPAQFGSIVKDDPNFRMGVTVAAQGAGLESATLNEFKSTAQGTALYVFQTPYASAPAASRSMATRSVTIDGNAIDLSQVDWSQESASPGGAVYSVTISGDAGPVAKVRKEFILSRKSDPSAGYELTVTQTIANLTDHKLNVRTSVNGPTLPPREQDRGGERQVLAGYMQKGYIDIAHDLIEGLTKDRTTHDYTKDSNGHPLSWIGLNSIYFNALVHAIPASADPNATADYIEKISSTTINPDGKPEEHEVLLTIDTTLAGVEPGQTFSLPLQTYLGPRQRSVLKSDYYSAMPLSYDKSLVLTSGPCGFCTFDWLVNVLVKMLAGFHLVTRDWGLAIIALVILVRVLLHPITKRSQISMSRMSKMGPEMERLKKKYGDNKDELNKAMMGVYKEQGITPILGCLPMFLQMPIWIALWQSLQTTFELRHAPFLWGFTWIHDLSKPDHLYTLTTPIPLLFGWQFSALNLLPLLLAVVFWFQAKLQPKPVAATPEQEQQQKMMQWMTLLFPVMLYTGPAGLNLYIFTSTGIGIIESKRIRDHIKQRDEAEKAGRVIVDAGKKFKGGGKDGSDPLGMSAKPQKPAGRIMGLLASLQQRAEQLRRDADKRK